MALNAPGTHSTLEAAATSRSWADYSRYPRTWNEPERSDHVDDCLLPDCLTVWPKCWWDFLHTQPIKCHWTQVSWATGKVSSSRRIRRFQAGHFNKTFYAAPQLQYPIVANRVQYKDRKYSSFFFFSFLGTFAHIRPDCNWVFDVICRPFRADRLLVKHTHSHAHVCV